VNNTTSATCGAGTAYPFGTSEFTPILVSGVHVTPRFWNSLHQVRSKSKDKKTKLFKPFLNKQKRLKDSQNRRSSPAGVEA
jgi:hypothetical protein